MAEVRAATGHGADHQPFELVVSAAPFETAGRRIADCVRELASAAPRAGEREIRLAIPGGSALAAVVHAAALLGPLWQRVALTWTDERCVPVDDPDSNRGAARRAGLLGGAGAGGDAPGSHAVDDSTTAAAGGGPGTGSAPARIVPLFEDGESPDAAVARSARRIAAELGDRLDIAVLGMGADGHVASLFPDRDAPRGGEVAHVPDAPKPPPHRITLTRRMLASARHTILVTAGEEKRAALDRLCAGDRRLPATALPGLVVVTDLGLARPEPMR